MKVSAKRGDGFEPVELNLVFEDEDNLRRFYALFNHNTLAAFFNGKLPASALNVGPSDEIRQAIKEVFPEIFNANGEYHLKLSKFINDKRGL